MGVLASNFAFLDKNYRTTSRLSDNFHTA